MVQDNLQAVYPAKAGDFTQALMELGATVCGPNRRPDCENCPCEAFCLAFRRGRAEVLPVRLPKSGRKMEEKTVFILSCDGAYALRKRPAKGLLAGLWEFPNVPGKLDAEAALEQVEKMGLKPKEIQMQVERKHIFTHIEWGMCGVYVEVSACEGEFVWMPLAEVEADAAMPTAFRQFLPTEKYEKI